MKLRNAFMTNKTIRNFARKNNYFVICVCKEIHICAVEKNNVCIIATLKRRRYLYENHWQFIANGFPHKLKRITDINKFVLRRPKYPLTILI